MKKYFRTLFLSVVIAAVPLFHTTIHAQTTYSTDFETAASYSWANDIAGNLSGVVTKAYGANSENKAFLMENPDTYTVSQGKFGSASYGTLKTNPVTGKSVFTFDFMFDADSISAHPKNEFYCGVRLFTKNETASAAQWVFRFIKRVAEDGSVSLGIVLPNRDGSAYSIMSDALEPTCVELDTWTRLTLVYDPETGKADFSIIKNVDTISPEMVTITDYQLTAANVYTAIDRMIFLTDRNNTKFYIDNVSLYECEGVKLVSASPVSGAEAPADGGITLVFSGKVEAQSLTLNGRAVTFDINETKTLLTYSGDMIANREYTLAGTVTDENGLPYQISHSFMTAPELKLLSATAKNGDTGITPTDTLLFEFNHRIDPCDNSFSITGGAEIESYNVKGNILEIKLSEVLEYDRYYTVKLEGLGDLYSEEYSEPEITFKTAGLDVNYAKFVDGDGESLSVIDSQETRYIAEFTNNTPDLQNIIFVMTLSENERIKEIVFEPYTVKPGDKLSIDEGFAGLDIEARDYQIKVFYLDGLDTLSPYDTQMLPIVTIGEQSEE